MRTKKETPDAKNRGSPRNRLLLARAFFTEGFKHLKALPKEGKSDREQDIFDNIYGTDCPDLERDLLCTIDGWLKDIKR